MKKTWLSFLWKQGMCLNPSHNPPMHLYIQPGQTYTHICPGCKKRTVMHNTTMSQIGLDEPWSAEHDEYLRTHCTCMNSDHDVPGGACTC